MAEALSFAIDRKQSVAIGITSGSPDVAIDSYASQEMDLQDIAAIGSGPGATSAGAIGHAIAEQMIKQVYGLANEAGDLGFAHGIALTFQAAVTGYRRTSSDGADLNRATITGSTVSHLAKGRERMTVTFYFVQGDLVRVERD